VCLFKGYLLRLYGKNIGFVYRNWAFGKITRKMHLHNFCCNRYLGVWFNCCFISLTYNFTKVSSIVILCSRTFPLTFGMYPDMLLVYEFPYALDCSFHPSREHGSIIAEKAYICRDISWQGGVEIRDKIYAMFYWYLHYSCVSNSHACCQAAGEAFLSWQEWSAKGIFKFFVVFPKICCQIVCICND
jgi:hypothetical protein